MQKAKIVYLEGRPQAHVIHRRLAESVGSLVDFIDPKIRWQDLNRSFIYNVFAWVVNAMYLAKKYKDCDVFLVDNLHFTPVIMNLLFRKRKKLVVHLGSHTLYFMYSRKFSFISNQVHKYFMSKYDVLIFEGQMARFLGASILKKKLPIHFTTFLGVTSERVKSLKVITPDLNSNTIVVIANGPTNFRSYYKGLDLMIRAFGLAFGRNNELELRILGSWPSNLINELSQLVDSDVKERVHFEGSVSEIESYFSKASLCFHCSRGDAFPTATLEAMMAGVPTMISEWTGTREVVENADSRMVIPLNERAIASSLIWYFSLSEEKKREISVKSRYSAMEYTEENAIRHYQSTFASIYKQLDTQ